MDDVTLISQDDLGSLLVATVRYALRCTGAYTAEYTGKLVRRHFAQISDYEKRQVVSEIDVELKRTLEHEREEWSKLVEEIRPPKAPFTIDYRCDKCKLKGVKLWRGVHGCKSAEGYSLLCAKCLAPDVCVSDDGRAPVSIGKGMAVESDQVAGWLPAVPVDDTFWGYTSTPTADVRWWRALPTYASKVTPHPDGGIIYGTIVCTKCGSSIESDSHRRSCE